MTKFVTAVLVLIFAFVLSGCAHYYIHPTKKSNAEFDQDRKECTRIGEREAIRNKTKPCDEIERCLFSKGWRR
jgi:hypothetical protein